MDRSLVPVLVSAGLASVGLIVYGNSILTNHFARTAGTYGMPASYNPRKICSSEKPTVDRFDSLGTFEYTPVAGCFAKVILPRNNDGWSILPAGVDEPSHWIAIACFDGQVAVPPTRPGSNVPFSCGGSSVRERNTFYFQGNGPIVVDVKGSTATAPKRAPAYATPPEAAPASQSKPPVFDEKAYLRVKFPGWDGKNTICSDGFDPNKFTDLSDRRIDHFELTLSESCYSAWIIFPTNWHKWSFQAADAAPTDGWISIWRETDVDPSVSVRLTDPEKIFPWLYPYHNPMRERIRGHGRVLFYVVERQ